MMRFPGRFLIRFIFCASALLSGPFAAPALAATLTSVQIMPSNPSITSSVLGVKQQFTAVGNYSDGSTAFLTASVTWSSSNPSIATISNQAGTNGLATTTGYGTTTITATFSGVSASTLLTSSLAALTTLTITPGQFTLPQGTAVQLTATGKFADGSTNDVTARATWNVADATVAGVNVTGFVTGLRQGQTTVTASLSGITSSLALTVTTQIVRRSPQGGVAITAGLQPGPNGAGVVTSYTIAPGTGAVRLLGSYGGGGSSLSQVAVDPKGRFAYVVGRTQQVWAYAIDELSGVLTSVAGSPYVANHPVSSVTVDSSGRFLYAGADNGQPSGIDAYSIDAFTGSLTPVPGSPYAVPTGAYVALVTDPGGKYLYAGGGSVAGFLIDQATGALMGMAGSPFPRNGGTLQQIAMDPKGRFLYAAWYGNGIGVYAINPSTGSLTSVSGSPFTSGPDCCSAVTVDGTGTFVYGCTINNANAVVGFIADQSTGALVPVPGAPFSELAGAKVSHKLAADASGNYVYSSGDSLVAYSIDLTTGSLAVVNSATAPGYGIAVTSVSPTTTGTPAVSLSMSTLAFGAQLVRNPSPAQTVTLTNTGNAALIFFSVTIAGANDGDFAQTNNCGTTLNPGANCAIVVTFTPLAAGSRAATITISDNAANSPQAISLAGTGGPPSACATISPLGQNVNASGGTAGLFVTAPSTCSWTATTDASWIAFSSTNSGSGNGSVYFSFQANPSTSSRTANITVGGMVYTLTQSGTVTSAPTAFQPVLVKNLAPGFYIVEATLSGQGATQTPGGYWGLEVIASQGQMSGGFNLGGSVQGGVQTPGFGAFLLQTPQTVTATLNAQVSPGTSLTMQFLDSNHSPLGNPVSGATPLTLSSSMQPGFYIIQVQSSGSTPFTYQLGLAADYFSGGVDTGGYIGPGVTGFGAFYIPQTQDVTIRLYGRNTYGSAGAGDLVLTLRDASRNVIQVVSP